MAGHDLGEQERDYYRRQGKLIQDRISAYREGRQTLNQLAQDLDGLGIAVSAFEPGWRTQYHKAWALLEQVNAGLLDERGRQPTPREHELIEDALTRLTNLASQLTPRTDSI
jgi:hypothetical protein